MLSACVVVLAGLVSCKNHKPLQSQPGRSVTALDSQYGNLFIDACQQRMKGNLKEARQLLQECLKLDPKNQAPHYELAMIDKMIGAKAEALNHAKLCAASNQQNEWYQLLLAECFVANNQIKNAIKIRENLIERFPKKNEYKEELAYEYSLVGDINRALKLYNDLETTYGVNEQTSYNKINIYKSIRAYKKAEEEFLKLIASDKFQIRFYNDLADLYTQTGQLEKAKGIYDKIILLDPDNPQVYLALHDYHVKKGNDAEAAKDLEKAIQNPYLELGLKTQILEEYYTRAEHGIREAYDEGLKLATIASSVHPTAMAIQAICGDYYRLDKNNKFALGHYYKAVGLDKNNYRLWQNLLIVENDMYLNDSVSAHASQALEIFPNQPVFYLYAGIANTALKRFQTAEQQLKDGLSLVYGNKRLMIDFLSAAGDNYFQLKAYDQSDKSFEEALKLDADNTFVLNNYAYYLSIRQANLELAEKLARRANEIRPNQANYMDTYAWVFFKEKKYLAALEWINQAVKVTQSPTILEHYGDILFFCNKLDEAIQQWNKAKDAGNKSDVLQRKIKDKKWYE